MRLDRTLAKILGALIIPFLFVSCALSRGGLSLRQDVSPFDFGLSEAKNGIERYEILLKTHQAAVQYGVNVNYQGIKKIEIEIPKNAARIPLTDNNDFNGCEFVIKNQQKTVYLFESLDASRPIAVSKSDIDEGVFSKYPELSKGTHILIIEDSNPWVKNRKGYSYGHNRREILLVKNGKASNKVVMPYDNEQSNPVCTYNDARPFSFKNLTIRRTEDCTAITNIMFVSGKGHVEISNVSLHTPENEWRNDRAIRIEDCTNVHFENVLIDGTYSQQGHSGYGISLNNIWNFTGNRIVGRGNWGIFGTNNVNVAHIENSAINRFDIHCYGRDVSFKNVEFSERYNQLASVYGDVIFDKCTFTDFDPLVNGGSYNAYVEHNVYFTDCVFNIKKKRHYLIKAGKIDDEINSRKELEKKCWPNIYIKNLTVNMDETITVFVLVYAMISGDISQIPVYNISTIDIDGLNINSPHDRVRLILTPKSVKTSNEIDCRIKNIRVNGKPIGTHSDFNIISNLKLKNDKIEYVDSKDK